MVMFLLGVISGMISVLIGLHFYGKHLDNKHQQHIQQLIQDNYLEQDSAIA